VERDLEKQKKKESSSAVWRGFRVQEATVDISESA